MELSSSNIKKTSYIFSKERFSYVFSKESFSYISGNGTLHFSAQAQKVKNNPPWKFLILQETETLKHFLYFPKRKLFLCFGKKEPRKSVLYFRKPNFHILQEKNIQNPAIT